MLSLPFRSLIFGVIASFIFFNDETNGKVFTQCGAAVELQRAGISRSFISNWVCLMQSTSNFDSQLITGPLQASSYKYGIFQISSSKWCARGRRGGICNKRCSDFADNDIRDDIACAKKIFDTEGFKAWDGWLKKCKNKQLPDVSGCRP